MQKEGKNTDMLSTNDVLFRAMKNKLDDHRKALKLLENAYFKSIELSLPYNNAIRSLIDDHRQLLSDYRGLFEQHMEAGRYINNAVHIDECYLKSKAEYDVSDETMSLLSMLRNYATILHNALGFTEAICRQHTKLLDSFRGIPEYTTMEHAIVQREHKIINAQNSCLSCAYKLIQQMKENVRSVCANCGNSYIEGDKYCRFCGAPMGTPVFIEESFACIYGPQPIKRIHTCEKCGFSWDTIAGILWSITIVGLPVGKQCFKMGRLCFFPFGKNVMYGGGTGSFLLNMVWI